MKIFRKCLGTVSERYGTKSIEVGHELLKYTDLVFAQVELRHFAPLFFLEVVAIVLFRIVTTVTIVLFRIVTTVTIVLFRIVTTVTIVLFHIVKL